MINGTVRRTCALCVAPPSLSMVRSEPAPHQAAETTHMPEHHPLEGRAVPSRGLAVGAGNTGDPCFLSSSSLHPLPDPLPFFSESKLSQWLCW